MQLAFLWFICLGLMIAILILILINAIRRTCFGHSTVRNAASGPNGARNKYVDLYATSLDALPNESSALPGMIALIDLGMTNFETGLYMLQANSWEKIGVPEVNDIYHILHGESAGKQHTIKPSFIHEIKVPAESQVFDNEHLYQELHELTATVHVQHDIRMPCHLTTSTQQTTKISSHGAFGTRVILIINTSPSFGFIFTIHKEQVLVAPRTMQHVTLLINKTNASAPYTLGATSAPLIAK